MKTATMTIMKCCNRAKHTAKCAQYWHGRQRDEVAKRVALEKEFNGEIIAANSRTTAAILNGAAKLNAFKYDASHLLALFVGDLAFHTGRHPMDIMAGDLGERW